MIYNNNQTFNIIFAIGFFIYLAIICFLLQFKMHCNIDFIKNKIVSNCNHVKSVKAVFLETRTLF